MLTSSRKVDECKPLLRGRANVQFLFRIYGQGASSLGRVQFKWAMVDTQPLSAPSLSEAGLTLGSCDVAVTPL